MSVAHETWAKVMASHAGHVLPFGPTNVDRYLYDPKRIAFFLSRYKFAAKMLRDCTSILDVGCGDGMGTVTFLADTAANTVHGIDFEPAVIEYANGTLSPALESAYPGKRTLFVRGDFLADDVPRRTYEGVCSLDVIEHLEPATSLEFVGRIAKAVSESGIAIIGTPNAYAFEYGSAHSKIGHINNLTADDLRAQMKRHFRQVFSFSMNDEIVHTGFDKLAHYLLAVGVK